MAGATSSPSAPGCLSDPAAQLPKAHAPSRRPRARSRSRDGQFRSDKQHIGNIPQGPIGSQRNAHEFTGNPKSLYETIKEVTYNVTLQTDLWGFPLELINYENHYLLQPRP